MGVEPIHARRANANVGGYISPDAFREDDRKLDVEVVGRVVAARVAGDTPDRLTVANHRISDRYPITVGRSTAGKGKTTGE
jgi:hypothetical protein